MGGRGGSGVGRLTARIQLVKCDHPVVRKSKLVAQLFTVSQSVVVSLVSIVSISSLIALSCLPLLVSLFSLSLLSVLVKLHLRYTRYAPTPQTNL